MGLSRAGRTRLAWRARSAPGRGDLRRGRSRFYCNGRRTTDHGRKRNPSRFSSKEQHEAPGLYYEGYRFYAPTLHRWINRDPIGEDGGVNLFRFLLNTPFGRIDPWGTSCESEREAYLLKKDRQCEAWKAALERWCDENVGPRNHDLDTWCKGLCDRQFSGDPVNRRRCRFLCSTWSGVLEAFGYGVYEAGRFIVHGACMMFGAICESAYRECINRRVGVPAQPPL